jgi:hypothetical protein
MAKAAWMFLVVAVMASAGEAITLTDLTKTTAADLATALTGGGVTITNVKYTGAAEAAGLFSGAAADGIGLDSGVVLSSGRVADVIGPNNSSSSGASVGAAGDQTLDALVAPNVTHDAAVLEFDVVTADNGLSITYVFASEEYPEYVGSKFNDVFAFFVDGANIALVPGTASAVAVNTVNGSANGQFYRSNPIGSTDYNTQFDGFTTVLQAFADVEPGVSHHIRLAIADTSDTIFDSAVFIAQGGVSGGAAASALVPDLGGRSSVLMESGQSVDVPFLLYGVPADVTPELFGDGMSADTTVRFRPALSPEDGVYAGVATITPGAQISSGSYTVLLHAHADTVSAIGSVPIIVDCRPPSILAAPGNQPLSQPVVSGRTTKLTVTPTGNGPFTYQWYRGHAGSAGFPVAGAVTSELVTPVVSEDMEFWVRVSNACGSADSNTAAIQKQ